MNRKIMVVVALLAAVFLVQVGVAGAQNLYGSIRGTVIDPSGAGVPDVSITATNMGTNLSQAVKSKQDGSYQFLQLQIGDYALKATREGFQTFNVARIHLDVNTIYTQDINLQIGAITQEITVQAAPVQVETTSIQLGDVITGQQILDAPLISRDWVDLQQSEPGVASGSDRFGPAQAGDSFSTNGSQTQQNSYLINGMDSADIALNTALVEPSPDAIGEFRMVTSTINPEYGRNSGAILNATIRSGTNAFHGDAFEFFRDTGLDASDFFLKQQNKVNLLQGTPPIKTVKVYHQNDFGGTVGGPIWKDHTFFFFSYEGRRFARPEAFTGPDSAPPVIPSSAEVGGNFSAISALFNGAPPAKPGAPPTDPKVSPVPLFGDAASSCPVSGGTRCPAGTYYGMAFDNSGALLTNGLFSTGVIPSQDFNSVATNLAATFIPSSAAGGLFTFNPAQTGKFDQFLSRIDHTFNNHDSVWFYTFWESFPLKETLPFQPLFDGELPGFGDSQKEHIKEYTFSEQHIFGGGMLNDLHAGFQRLNFVTVAPQKVVLPSSVGFTGINPQLPSQASYPAISVAGAGGVNFALGFSDFGPQPRIDQTFQAGDDFSFVHGNHTIKFGYEWRRFEVHNPFSAENNGQFSFGGGGPFSTGVPTADFLLGFPDTYTQSSGGLTNARSYEDYAFIQDQFKLKPNLTLTYGTGWDVETPLSNFAFKGISINCFTPGVQSRVYPTAPQGLLYPGDQGCSQSGYTTHLSDFGPRLGIAWSPNLGWLGSSGKLSIRAGFGMYYNRPEEELTLQFLTNPPFGLTSPGAGSIASAAGVSTSANFTTPFTSVNPLAVNFTAYNGTMLFTAAGCAPAAPPCPNPTPTTPTTVPSGSIANPFRYIPPPAGSAVNFAPYEPMGLATILPNFRSPYAENYNLTIQRELPGQTILSVAYVGSMGHRLEMWVERNPGAPLGCASDPKCITNPFFEFASPSYGSQFNPLVFGSIGTMTSLGNSNYNSLQVTVNKHTSHGLTLLAAYTYAHSLDWSSSFEDATFNAPATDPFNPRHFYGNSSFDFRHRLVATYSYDLPKVPGTRGNALLDRLANGWRISGITTFQTGLPVHISSEFFGLLGASSGTCPGLNMFTVGIACWDTVNVTGPIKKMDPRNSFSAAPKPSFSDLWFDPSAFSAPCPPAGVSIFGPCAPSPFNPETGGTAKRNFFHGPGLNDTDFELTKSIPIRESIRFELRADFENIFNHAQFASPLGNFASGGFGSVNSLQVPDRIMQLAGKFYF